jgi:hypothetical protein
MPKSQKKKDIQALLQEAEDASPFSLLTYLLQAVTTLNSIDNLQSGFQAKDRHVVAKDEPSSHSLNFTLLDSIVAILVQQHEVVAACYTSDQVSVVVAETDPNPSTDLDVPVESPSPGSHTFYPLQLAAVANPDFKPSYFVIDSANQHNFQILPKGQDLWPRIKKFKWFCALA